LVCGGGVRRRRKRVMGVKRELRMRRKKRRKRRMWRKVRWVFKSR
jgi:hypothetical protein